MSFVGRYNVCKSCLHDWLDNEFLEGGGPEVGATLNIMPNGFGCDLGYCDYTQDDALGGTPSNTWYVDDKHFIVQNDDLLDQTQTFPGEVMNNG